MTAAPFALRAGPDTGLGFRPSEALRRETLDAMVARLTGRDPDAAAAISDAAERIDVDAVFRDLARPFGLRDDDTADILAAYHILGWLIATGGSEPSAAAAGAVRAQLARELGVDPHLAAPQTRARLGEELKLLFVTLHAGWQAATREGNAQSFSDGVAAMFAAQSGRDLRAVELTDAGFAPR